MKCTNCGSKDLFKHYLIGHENSHHRGQVCFCEADNFVCKNCRHIEWFMTADAMQQIYKNENAETEFNKMLATYEIEKSSIQKRISELQKIVNNENQTVKAVNNAKQQIVQLNDKLNNLVKPHNSKLGPFASHN